MSEVYVRRAAALTFALSGEGIVVRNVLTKRSCTLAVRLITLLADLEEPTARGQAEEVADSLAISGGSQVVEKLLVATVVLSCGEPVELRDQQWRKCWGWSAATADAHFGTVRGSSPDWKGRALDLAQRAAHSPPLTLPPQGRDPQRLPAIQPRGRLHDLISRRRTCRQFTPGPISLEMLSALLFAIAGHCGSAEDSVLGSHPLTTSPSGGARNPFEVYLIAHNVMGLEPGTYHYCGVEDTVSAVGPAPQHLRALCGDQPWMAQGAVLIVLVSYFERAWAKYPSPRAYNVTLLEAGHRMQNLLLAAAELGLGACVTTEFRQDLADTFHIDGVCHQATYGAAVGCPDMQRREFRP